MLGPVSLDAGAMMLVSLRLPPWSLARAAGRGRDRASRICDSGSPMHTMPPSPAPAQVGGTRRQQTERRVVPDRSSRLPIRPGRPRGVRSLAARSAAQMPRPVAQHVLLDLAGRGFRQLGEHDRLGRLEVGEHRCGSGRSAPARWPAAPAFRVTNAQGLSPHFSSGRATTAASSTAGCRYSAPSTSIEEMFSPPEMMMSFERSLTSM